MAEWSGIDYLLAQNDDEVLHVGKDGTRYNGGTWSPWIGCDKGDRPGCAHCWAEMWARRNPRFRGHWGRNAPRYFFPETHWQQPLRWQRKCERLGVRKRMLVSLCDPFEVSRVSHARQLIELRRLLTLIEQTPLLTWLVLTKRPDMALAKLPLELPDNLWLGVSCWDQASADRMIPPAARVPAALHWVSLEPLLGPVDLDPLRCDSWHPGGIPCDVHHDHGCQPWCIEHDSEAGTLGWLDELDWVVVGCESRGARPRRRCDLAWVHEIGNQCHRAGVPCFIKQLPDDGNQGRLIKSAELAEHGWPVQMPRRSP